MKNYKLVLSYDGSRYKGWQKLGGNELTIQQTVEDTISKILEYPVEIHGSGRTDGGVHARGQVASMKVPFRLQEDFREKINESLPEDICLVAVELADNKFHARYSAKQKIYSYHVDLREKSSVFERKYTCHYPWKVEIEPVKEAVKLLIGRHDFSGFTDDKTDKDKIREIYKIDVTEKNGKLVFEYCGDGFLQHMVRILTGTLLEIGCGEKKPDDVKFILEKKERAYAGFMAPAKGLFLEKVIYD